MNIVVCGDSLEKLKDFADNTFDSVITDPPYEIGFMGRNWDATGVAYSVEMWKEVFRVLKPGGHLLAFGGTRTYHRMACAVEDAGFEIRDCLQWLYGSGWPKGMDISKTIDKAARGVPQGGPDPTSPNHGKYKTQATEGRRYEGDSGRGYGAGPGQFMKTKGVKNERELVAEAKPWEGWFTSLKPAHEPIVLARKPLSEKTVAGNVLKWGTGGLNIDGCRIPTNEVIMNHSRSAEAARSKGKYGDSKAQETHQTLGQMLGRWPANVLLDESWEPVMRLKDDICPEVRALIEETFSGYGDLSKLQTRVSNLSEQIEEWQREVLRSEMLRRTSECDLQREKPSDVRTETLRGVHREDEEGKGEFSFGGRPPIVQRGLVQSGVQVPEYPRSTFRAEENSGEDGGKESSGNTRAQANNGSAPRKAVGTVGSGTPQERSQGRQQDRKPGATRQFDAYKETQGNHKGVKGLEKGERGIEVLACDIPERWKKYFEPTGLEARSPYCAAALLDEQSGITKSGAMKRTVGSYEGESVTGFLRGMSGPHNQHGDSGGASRFFYVAKASRSERTMGGKVENNHPTVKPIKLIEYLITLITPPGGIVLDPFAGSGTTALAAINLGFNYVLIEKEEEYVSLINERINNHTGRRKT